VITVDDCVRASRAIEGRLDSEPDVIEERYVLEVSSPGIDRKLVRAADWRRFGGRKVNVNIAALGGRVEVVIVGIDGPEGGEVVTVRDARGVEHHVSLGEMSDARLAVHWP
jgi:ribosome maturation factor RimP